ncbi:MAG TPA: DUF1656 domain-containing protein [Dokdonella sp.]
MYGLFSLYGIYVPVLLALMALAYVLNGALRRVLARLGAYRWIWHPALFNLAMYVVVLGALFAACRAVQP